MPDPKGDKIGLKNGTEGGWTKDERRNLSVLPSLLHTTDCELMEERKKGEKLSIG